MLRNTSDDKIKLQQAIRKGKRLSQSLRECEKKYRNLFDNAQVGLFRSRFSDSKLLVCNNRYAEVLGYESQQRCLSAFFAADHYQYPEDRKRMLAIIEKSGRIDNFDCPVLREDGSIVFVRFSAHLDREGNYIEGVMADITEQKRVERELQKQVMRNEMILQTTIAGFCLVSMEMKILQINNAACGIIGYSREEMTNRSLQDFIDNQSLRELMQHIDKVNKNGSDCFEMKYQHKDGNILYLRICTNFLEIDEEKHYFSFFYDITERKLAHLALHKREKELQIKTEGLEEINTALKVLLKKRQEDKTDLEENVLHNIREVIVPYLEKLSKSGLTERQEAYLEIIKSNLNGIISPFSRKLTSTYLKFTPGELQIANLIKQGKSTKEIADLLCLSPETISFHRKNIRKKIGIQKQNIDLTTFLLSLDE